MQIESGSQQFAHRSNILRNIRHIHLDADPGQESRWLGHEIHTNFLAMCFNFLILNVPQLAFRKVHAASCAVRTTVDHQFLLLKLGLELVTPHTK